MGTLAGHDHGRQQDAGRRGRLLLARGAALCESRLRGKTANPATRLLAHPSGDRVAVGYPRCARLGGKTAKAATAAENETEGRTSSLKSGDRGKTPDQAPRQFAKPNDRGKNTFGAAQGGARGLKTGIAAVFGVKRGVFRAKRGVFRAKRAF